MDITKETIVKVKDTIGKNIAPGTICLFTTKNHCLYGKYTGLTARGNLKFESVQTKTKVTFAVSPKSIVEIYAQDED